MMGDHGLLLRCFTVLHAIYSRRGSESVLAPENPHHRGGSTGMGKCNSASYRSSTGTYWTQKTSAQFKEQTEDPGAALGNSEIRYG